MEEKKIEVRCTFFNEDSIYLIKDLSCEEDEIYIDVSNLTEHNGVYINKKSALEIIDFLKVNVLEKGSK